MPSNTCRIARSGVLFLCGTLHISISSFSFHFSQWSGSVSSPAGSVIIWLSGSGTALFYQKLEISGGKKFRWVGALSKSKHFKFSHVGIFFCLKHTPRYESTCAPSGSYRGGTDVFLSLAKIYKCIWILDGNFFFLTPYIKELSLVLHGFFFTKLEKFFWKSW